MLMRNMLVLAIAQAAFGTPGVPAVGVNAIQAMTAMPSPISLDFVPRTLLKGYKGNFGQFGVGEYRMIEFEVECGSSGTAGTAPRFAPMLLGCGMSETLVALTSATYNLVNSGEPFYTIYCFLDGLRFSLEDAKGTVTFEGNSKGVPKLKLRYIGKYVVMTDNALPAGAVFTNQARPQTIGKTNTPTFTVHGTPVIMSAFSWDLGNKLEWRDMPNFQGVVCTDRAPTANVTFELTTVAIKNWAELARLGTEAPLQMIHGVGAGNIVQIDMPKINMSAAPTISDDAGIAMLATQWNVNPNAAAGSDELVLQFR